MPRIPYMSTPAAPGLYRQGNIRIARSASSLASNVFPIRLRRVYAYTFSLVPCFYRRRSPLQLRSTAGANACPHGAGRTPCLSRVPVSFSVSLTFFSHGFQIYGHRARTFLSSLLAFGSCMHLLSRLKLSFLFLLAAHSCTLLFSTGFFFSFSFRLLPYVFSLLSRLFCSLAGLGTGWSKRRAAAAVYDTIPQSHIVDSVF